MALADQTPIHSGFHAKTTAGDVLAEVDLAGKTAIVKGGYSGIGLETVRALAETGACVIVPVRSQAKARDSLAGLTGDIRTAPMELADIACVQRLAASITDDIENLDLLIDNAGVMTSPEARVGPG